MLPGMRVRTLDTMAEVRSLADMLGDYTRFVCAEMAREFGLAYEPETLIRQTMDSLHKVLPPEGRSFVAEDGDGRQIGMVFLRKSGADAMEIKRLYVRPEGRGSGAGRALVAAALDEARAVGVEALRLDSLSSLRQAIGLYRDMGFDFRDPYPESDHFSDAVLDDVFVFMERAPV